MYIWKRNIIFSHNKLANVSGIWRPNWDSESQPKNIEKKLMRKFPCYAGIHCGCQADDFGCGTMASHFIQYGKPWIVGGQHPNWAVVTWWHQRDTVNVNLKETSSRFFGIFYKHQIRWKDVEDLGKTPNITSISLAKNGHETTCGIHVFFGWQIYHFHSIVTLCRVRPTSS